MVYLLKIFVFICSLLIATFALPTDEYSETARNSVNSENELIDSIYSDCLKKDSIQCVKYKLFSIVDKVLEKRDTLSLAEGVTVVKTPGLKENEGAPRGLNNGASIETLILGRLQNFLQTHTIKVELKGSDIVNAVSATSRALDDASSNILNEDQLSEEGRGKGKKKAKLLGPLLMAVALKGIVINITTI